MNELKNINKLVRRWRSRAEDCGPMAARAYLDAANDLESEIRKSAQLVVAVDGVVVAVDGAGSTDIEASAERDHAKTELGRSA